ncbi:MAG: dioxygenase [Burkholderiales bacterium]|nr:dioxygenase [Burkholderiales bacterium]
MTTRHPAVFVSHGAPTLALEPGSTRGFLAELGAALPRPRAILAVSAHWETATPAVGTAARPETIHDFRGFPEALYRMRYPAPGAPALAQRVRALLGNAGLDVAGEAGRGLDHGAWVPLSLMYPAADIPVTQLSVQTALGPAHHWRLGELLRPLRDEGVLILGSGSVTHNLREFGRHDYASPPPDWVRGFNDWLAERLAAADREALLDYRGRAPHAARNHPSEEHLLPLFAALGAATPGAAPRRLHAAYTYGVIGMDAWRFD